MQSCGARWDKGLLLHAPILICLHESTSSISLQRPFKKSLVKFFGCFTAMIINDVMITHLWWALLGRTLSIFSYCVDFLICANHFSHLHQLKLLTKCFYPRVAEQVQQTRRPPDRCLLWKASRCNLRSTWQTGVSNHRTERNETDYGIFVSSKQGHFTLCFRFFCPFPLCQTSEKPPLLQVRLLASCVQCVCWSLYAHDLWPLQLRGGCMMQANTGYE